MIVRVLNEGQFRLDDEAVNALNAYDDRVEEAVNADDQETLTVVLNEMLDDIRAKGEVVPDEELADSDLILPDGDATVLEVRAWLSDTDDGLIPG